MDGTLTCSPTTLNAATFTLFHIISAPVFPLILSPIQPHLRAPCHQPPSMVRIKERYLLVNIIYPPDASKQAALPSLVVQHQPTTDELTYQSLIKAIRAEIAALFGDYGSGSLSKDLSSTWRRAHLFHVFSSAALTPHSQVPVARHIYLHCQVLSSSLPDALGRIDLYGSRPH